MRGGGLVLAILSVVATAFLALVAVVVFRLALAPVDLSSFSSRFTERLHAMTTPYVVSFGELSLTLSPWQGQIDITFIEVRVDHPDRGRVADAERLEVAFGLAALVGGEVSPGEIKIVAPRASVVRNADGITLISADGEALPAFSPGAGSFHVSLSGGEFDFRNEGSNRTWHLRDTNTTIERDFGAWAAQGAALLQTGNGEAVRIRGELRLEGETEELSGELSFQDFIPADFAGSGEGFADLSSLRIPLRGGIQFTSGDGSFRTVIEAEGGRGTLDLFPESFGGGSAHLAVDSLRFQASFDEATRAILLEEILLTVEGEQIRTEGEIQLGDAGTGNLSGELIFRDLVPAVFATLGGELDRLALFRVPLQGSFRFGLEDGFLRGAVNATGEGGAIDFPHGPLDDEETLLAVKEFGLRAGFDARTGRVIVEDALLEAEGMRVRATGEFGIEKNAPVRSDAKFEGNITARELIGRARAILGADAVAWLDSHLLASDVHQADVTLAFPDGLDGSGDAVFEAQTTNVEIDWRPGKPPFVVPKATLTIDGRRLAIRGSKGSVGPAMLSDISFTSPDIHDSVGAGIFVAWAHGAAGELLGLTGLNLDGPGLVRGQAKAGLRIRVPFVLAEGEDVGVDATFQNLELLPGFLPGALGETRIEELSGTAAYGPSGLDVRAEARIGEELALSEIHLAAQGMTAEATLEGRLEGDVQEMLSLGEIVLSGDAVTFPLMDEGVRGRGDLRFRLHVPLAGADEATIEGIEGTFEDLILLPGTLSGPFSPFGSEDISGTLKFHPGWLTVEGSGVFAGSDISFSWRDKVGEEVDEGRITQALTIEGTLRKEALALIGFDDYLEIGGTVDVQGSLVRPAGENQWRLTLDGDLSRATLGIPTFAWNKPLGAPLTARLSGGVGEEISRMSLLAAGENLAVEGVIAFASNGDIKSAWLDQFDIGETRGTSEIHVSPDGTINVLFVASFLDLRSILKVDVGNFPVPARVKISAQEVFAGGPVPFGPLRFDLVSGLQGIEEVKGSFGLPGNDILQLDAKRKGDSLEIRIEGTDAGEAAQALGMGNAIRDGPFTISATRDEIYPGKPISGQISMGTFRLVGTPVFARLLQVATLTGAFEAMVMGEGISFNAFDGDFTLEGRRVRVANGKASGFSMGMKFDGLMDIRAGMLDVTGVLIPGFVISEALAPGTIVGDIFTGLDGDGVFVVDFRVHGPADDPEIESSPLSLLLPGILRDLIQPLLEGGDSEESEEG